jgi:hypothetical protein
MAALIIGEEERAALQRLREHACTKPFDAREVVEQTKQPSGLKRHIQRMTKEFSVALPQHYKVTYSIETNHPSGTMRHLSVSTQTPGLAPGPAVVWMVAEELGFAGGLDVCGIWIEDIGEHELGGRQVAINVVQPFGTIETFGHA